MESLLETIHNSNLPINQRIDAFKKNEVELGNFVLTLDDEQKMRYYDFVITQYLRELVSDDEKIKNLQLLKGIEKDLRKLPYSEEKMILLEEFQFNFAHFLYLNKEHFKSRNAFEQLIECRPNNNSYKKYWAKNEYKIAKLVFRLSMLLLVPGIISSVVFMVIFKGEWPIYMFFFLLAPIVILSLYKVYWIFKSR